jgi:pimeloyl-ACP methyl ester carboxylesterase
MESRSKQDMQATRNTAERGESRQRRKITQADLTPEEKRLLYEDPDVEIYPALFVPGYASPAFYSRVFRNRLEDANIEVYTLKLPRLATGDIKLSAEVLAERVEELKRELRVKKLNLIGHSLGGIIIRYYLKRMDGWKNVKRAVYMATPHHGVPLARLVFFTKAGRQLLPGSDFLNEVQDDPSTCRKARCLSVYSVFDPISQPAESCHLDCAYNKKVYFPVGHMGLLLSERAVEWIAGFLEGRFDDDENFAKLARKIESTPPMRRHLRGLSSLYR